MSNTDKRGRGVIAEADLPGKGKNEDSNEGEAQSRNSIERAVHATRQRNEPTRYVRGFPEEARPASQSTFQPDTDAIQSGEKEAEGERERESKKWQSWAKMLFLVFHAWIIDVSPRFLSG